MYKDKIFAKGIFFNKKHQKQPDFVLGKVRIKPDQFISFLNENLNKADSKGFINLDVIVSKNTNKPYLEVNTWQPSNQQKPQPVTHQELVVEVDADEEIPF